MAKKILQTRFRANPNRDGSYGDHQGEWTDEGEFSFNKHGEISSAGSKFLRSIDRDRYEVRWVPVAKKTKVDETATLNVSTTDGAMNGSTTFTAEDTLQLVQLLKNAGVKSAMYNGPATLTVDAVNGISSIVSNISAPDLRSIMQLLEPEFQQVGDAEAEVVEPEMAPEMPTDASCVDCEFEVEPEVDMGMDLEDPMDEEAEYDYRTHKVGPEEFAGKASKEIVQPATKSVPARSGDNPLAEGPFDDKRGQFPDTEQGAIEFMKFMSSHNMDGATARPDPVVDGVWLVNHKGGKSIVYLNDMDFEDIDEAVKPKSFRDYFLEAQEKNPVVEPKKITAESLMAELLMKLKPSMGADAYIDDFVHSDDPRFAGKSKEERRKMALGAFYGAKKK